MKVVVGHDTDSCTSEAKAVVIDSTRLKFELVPPNRRVVLVDMPGFCDTYLSPGEILRKIVKWLRAS
jgi:hypothetical protein